MSYPKLFLCCLLLLTGCSPLYVVRAGWEESQILLKRRPIEDVVKAPQTAPETARKLALVAEARAFAPEIGLEHAGGFSTYSEVDRPVLVWVVSASSKTALRAKTWWFPIVGRVPYKGFFEKEEAVEAARKLEQSGFDAVVRGSLAYSTLGWFDDPVLSTMTRLDDASLIETVFHEMTHSTVWIPGSADFNESLAAFVGAQAAVQFFEKHKPELARLARARWEDEQMLGRFVERASRKLEDLYSGAKHRSESKDEILFQRRRVFWVLKHEWTSMRHNLKTDRYTGADFVLNNASVLASRVYLSGFPSFQTVFQACRASLPEFLSEIKVMKQVAGELPWATLARLKHPPFCE